MPVVKQTTWFSWPGSMDAPTRLCCTCRRRPCFWHDGRHDEQSDLPEGWCWRVRLTMARDFRYRGHKPHLMPAIFYNQESAWNSLESQWEGFRDLAQELGKSWADAEMELVLTQLPDAVTCEEEQREERVARGWPYEAVYGTPPLDAMDMT